MVGRAEVEGDKCLKETHLLVEINYIPLYKSTVRLRVALCRSTHYTSFCFWMHQDFNSLQRDLSHLSRLLDSCWGHEAGDVYLSPSPGSSPLWLSGKAMTSLCQWHRIWESRTQSLTDLRVGSLPHPCWNLNGLICVGSCSYCELIGLRAMCMSRSQDFTVPLHPRALALFLPVSCNVLWALGGMRLM